MAKEEEEETFFTPTDKQRAEVSALKSFGIREKEIAAFLGVTVETLVDFFYYELESSATRADAQVGRFLFSLASGLEREKGATNSECLRAAIFWAKTRMGWTEATSLEVNQKFSGDLPQRVEIIGRVAERMVDDFSEENKN